MWNEDRCFITWTLILLSIFWFNRVAQFTDLLCLILVLPVFANILNFTQSLALLLCLHNLRNMRIQNKLVVFCHVVAVVSGVVVDDVVVVDWPRCFLKNIIFFVLDYPPTQSLSYTDTHSLSLSLSQTHIHIRSLAHTHSSSLSHTHTQTQTSSQKRIFISFRDVPKSGKSQRSIFPFYLNWLDLRLRKI